jgi:hypothetical protein
MLTTGWHSGSNLALDWDNTSSNSYAYFRGYFKLADQTTKEWLLTGTPVTQFQGTDVCDIVGVWISEDNHGLRAIPMYMHITIGSTAQFAIATQDTALYADRIVGTMLDNPDGDLGCQWDGSHVHEYHTPDEVWDSSPNVTEVRHMDTAPEPDVYPVGGSYIDNFPNDNVYNFTRNFYWTQGS